MTTFYRYPLPISAALEDYQRRFGCYPTIVTVNRANLTAAQAMGLAPVTSGGCLASEIWLSEPSKQNDNGGPAPMQLSIF